ncbi:MAG TPA: MarC family protein [Candidatus Binatia bacterium]|nr:MarC family protein [Candidatus Binatia bacterium]
MTAQPRSFAQMVGIAAGTVAWTVPAFLALASPALAQDNAALPVTRVPGLSQVFVLFFVMLGPFKIIAPFAVMTKDAEDKARRRLAVRAFTIASVTTLIAAAVGHVILENWHVSLGSLLIAGGVILFLVALRQVLQQYAPAPEAEARPVDAAHANAAIRLAFPTIVTPYGIAAVIILLSVSPDLRYLIGVAVALIGVMALNLLAMLYARRILAAVGVMPLQIVGTVLNVLQVALGVQMIVAGLRLIGMVAPAPV